MPPHGEKGSKKAFNDEKSPPPHGEINVATRPPFYFTIFILQQMLYISWIFVLASHSTNIFLLFFYLPPTTLCGRYSPFLFSFSRGQSPSPPPPIPTHPLPPWTSACPPSLFHFACIVYQSPHPNFISKT